MGVERPLEGGIDVHVSGVKAAGHSMLSMGLHGEEEEEGLASMLLSRSRLLVG